MTPQRFYILRSGPALHPLTRDYAAAIRANGAAVANDVLRIYDRRLIRPLVSQSLWNGIADLGAFVGHSDLNAALVKVKSESPATRVLGNTNFVTADLAPSGTGAGLKGNGSTKHLTNGAVTVESSNSSAGVMASEIQTTGTAPMFLSWFSSSVSDLTLHAGTNTVFNCSVNNIAASVATAGTTGVIIGTRTSASLATLYRNGASVATNATASTAFTASISPFLFARNTAGSAGNHSSARPQAYFIGQSLSAAAAQAMSDIFNQFGREFGAAAY